MWRPSHFVVLCNDQRRDVLFLNLLYQSVCWFTIALEHVLILKKGESRTEAYIFDSRSGHFFSPFMLTFWMYREWKYPFLFSTFYVLRLLLQLHTDKKQISVGFIGYPNVGKSSIINTLRSKKVCNVAPLAGETKVRPSPAAFSPRPSLHPSCKFRTPCSFSLNGVCSSVLQENDL